MPLTAFSKVTGEELDVDQLIRRLAGSRDADTSKLLQAGIPDGWKQVIREDMECPSCFTLGADLVRDAVSSQGSKRVVRQACFRYPMHLPQCDFARPGMSGTATPDNLVSFGAAKTGLTRAVRQLVGSGIQSGAFSQRTIRDMRQWFFAQKVGSTFTMKLDPQLPTWLDGLLHLTGGFYRERPITLTQEIAALPGFDWRGAARREYRARYLTYVEAMVAAKLQIWTVANRAAHLASRFQGEIVFDPSPLQAQYLSTIHLAEFISDNYEPIGRFAKNRGYEKYAPAVLAFAALLLYVEHWNVHRAAALFGRIALGASVADGDLGNVIGLNPWHDFEAWRQIKALQDLGLVMPVGAAAAKEEISAIEATLRRQYSGDQP